MQQRNVFLGENLWLNNDSAPFGKLRFSVEVKFSMEGKNRTPSRYPPYLPTHSEAIKDVYVVNCLQISIFAP